MAAVPFPAAASLSPGEKVAFFFDHDPNGKHAFVISHGPDLIVLFCNKALRSFNQHHWRQSEAPLTCFPFGQYRLDERIPEGSMGVVAFAITPDSNDPSGLALYRLVNRFHPSEELRSGFDYRFNGIVFRAHEKHVQGERAAIEEFHERMENIVDEAFRDRATIPKKIAEESRKAIQHVQRLIQQSEAQIMRPDSHSKVLSMSMEKLRKGADELARQKKFKPSTTTSERIIKLRKKMQEELNTLKKHIQSGSFGSRVREEQVENSRAGMAKIHDAIEAISMVGAESREQTEHRQQLQSEWQEVVAKYDDLLEGSARINAAVGPVAKIYTETKLTTTHELNEACKDCLSKIADHDPRLRADSYANHREYRRSLVEFYSKLVGFFERSPLDVQERFVIPEVGEKLQTLKLLNRQWDAFNELQQGLKPLEKQGVYFSNLRLTQEHFVKKFDDISRKVSGGLVYQMLHAYEPAVYAFLDQNLDQLLCLLVEYVALRDEAMRIANQVDETGDAIAYKDAWYATKRKTLDQDFYLVANAFLLAGGLATEGAKAVAKMMKEYGCKRREYGALREPLELKTPLTAIADRFKGLHKIAVAASRHLIDVIDVTDEDSARIKQLQEQSRTLKHLNGGAHLSMVSKAVFDTVRLGVEAEVAASRLIVQRVYDWMQTVRVPSADVNQQIELFRAEILPSLRRLRALYPRHSKDITALIQVLEGWGGESNVHPGLRSIRTEARQMKKRLEEVQRKTTVYDRAIRDAGVERFDELISALSPDSQSELLIRLKDVLRALPAQTDGPNPDEQQLQTWMERIKELDDGEKGEWLKQEVRYCHPILLKMIRLIALNDFARERRKFEEMAEDLDLSVLRREWVVSDRTSKETECEYVPSRSPESDSRYYRENRTHIPFF